MPATAPDHSATPHCSPSRPCHRWRTCPRCAARRQAHIADAAGRLADAAGPLRWTIIEPLDQLSIDIAHARASWLRAANPAGAIWTIEQAPGAGRLHCNIITPDRITPPTRAWRAWAEPIHGNPRHVAAYISKPSQFPPHEAYTGRLYGTAGPLWRYLVNGQAETIAAAAALQYELDRAPILAALQILHPGRPIDLLPMPEPSRADYRAIAAKYLPALLEKTHPTPRDTRPLLADEWFGAEPPT